MHRHSRKNYYEDLTQKELINKLAQILWYARPGPKSSWHRVGNSEKEVYRRTAAAFVNEIKFRVDTTRTQIAKEKWEANQEKQDIKKKDVEVEEPDEHEILGIKGHKQ